MKDESPLPPFPITASRLFTGLAVFGAVLAPFRPLPGTVLAFTGAGAYLLGEILHPRAREHRRRLSRLSATTKASIQKIEALEKTLADLRDRLIRLENRGRP